MNSIHEIREVEVIGRHRLRLVFDDGAVRELNLEGQLDGPVFDRFGTPHCLGACAWTQKRARSSGRLARIWIRSSCMKGSLPSTPASSAEPPPDAPRGCVRVPPMMTVSLDLPLSEGRRRRSLRSRASGESGLLRSHLRKSCFEPCPELGRSEAISAAPRRSRVPAPKPKGPNIWQLQRYDATRVRSSGDDG